MNHVFLFLEHCKQNSLQDFKILFLSGYGCLYVDICILTYFIPISYSHASSTWGLLRCVCYILYFWVLIKDISANEFLICLIISKLIFRMATPACIPTSKALTFLLCLAKLVIIKISNIYQISLVFF